MKQNKDRWRTPGLLLAVAGVALLLMACQLVSLAAPRESKAEQVILVTGAEAGRELPSACGLSGMTYKQLMQKGAVIYDGSCRACHGMQGQGTVDGFFPALEGSGVTQNRDPQMAIDFLMTTDIHPVASRLFEKDVASVMTYIRNSFGNSAPPVCPEDVELKLIP